MTYSAILHDFGKLKISEDILCKEHNLTPEEFEIYKTHPVIGYHFVKEDKIPKFGKIIAIADLFVQANSSRYSKEIKGPLGVLKLIQDESITKLDSSYCNMFLNHIVNIYMGENVLLNDERSCKIIQVHINDLTKPILLDGNGFLDLKMEKDLFVEKFVI